jgi:hypothetical protein
MSVDLLQSISAENLNVYRASPIRLREDVSQEAQISNDYRGRLVYELLQNADDAMTGRATGDDRIIFRLTDTDLWVGNSGRPLNESDVKGLCGLGASGKGEIAGRRRASIGHKGMGFKSVLEITAAPEVVSDEYGGSGTATLAAQLQREAVVAASRDRNYAALGRGGDAALPAVLVVAAAPREDAAALSQGETVGVPGGDRPHALLRRGGDAALPAVDEVAAPGEDAALLRQGEAVVKAGGDRLHAASGGGGYCALLRGEAVAAPREDAAALGQGEAVGG